MTGGCALLRSYEMSPKCVSYIASAEGRRRKDSSRSKEMEKRITARRKKRRGTRGLQFQGLFFFLGPSGNPDCPEDAEAKKDQLLQMPGKYGGCIWEMGLSPCKLHGLISQ